MGRDSGYTVPRLRSNLRFEQETESQLQGGQYSVIWIWIWILSGLSFSIIR